MNKDLSDSLFGPLSKDYCFYFYYFAVAGFIIMIMFIILSLVFIVRFYKKLNANIIMNLVAMIINSFLLYFSNRLLFTICMKSL